MDIDIDALRGNVDPEEDHRVSPCGQDVSVGLHDGSVNNSVSDEPPIDIEVEAVCVAAAQRGKASIAPDTNVTLLELNPSKLVHRLPPEHGLHPDVVTFCPKQFVKDSPIVAQPHRDARIGEAESQKVVQTGLKFGPDRLHELSFDRKVKEEILNHHLGSNRTTDLGGVSDLCSFAGDLDSAQDMGWTGPKGQTRDRGDAWERLSSEPKGLNIVEIGEVSNFGGAMALQGQGNVFRSNPLSVIVDPDLLEPGCL